MKKTDKEKGNQPGNSKQPVEDISQSQTKQITDQNSSKIREAGQNNSELKNKLKPSVQQDTLKLPEALSKSVLSGKLDGPSSILKKKLFTQGSSEYDTLSAMSRQIGVLERLGKKNNMPQFNWKEKQERMLLYNMQKKLTFEEIKVTHIRELTRFSQNDQKGIHKTLYVKQATATTDNILTVAEQSRLEKLVNYEDRWPLLPQRKSLQKIRIYINIAAQKIVKNKIFENFSICVIMANSVTLGLSDPLEVGTTPTETLVDNIFLGLYTTEMVMKIICYGFIFNKGAYIRDPWNILDFIIVMSAYLTLFQTLAETMANGGEAVEMTYGIALKQAQDHSGGGLSLNSLRAFRVLRPLKAVTSIKGLQVLVLSVLTSLPLLKDTMLVLGSFFLVFAIACTQLLSGYLKNRCILIDKGIPMPDSDYQVQGVGLCGGSDTCEEGYFCGKSSDSPNDGITNFDNIMYSLLVIFIVVTMEGWSDIMIYYYRSFNSLSWILFFPMVFIGSFFLINLLLAVINSSFSATFNEQKRKMAAEKAKKKKKKPVGADEMVLLEDDEHIMGINQYWVAKRAAQRMLHQLRKLQVRKATEELERRNRPPTEEDDEPRQIVVAMPEPYDPPEEVAKESALDAQSEEEDYEFENQLQNLLLTEQKEDTYLQDDTVITQRRLVSKDINNFAVNDMRTANNKQLKKPGDLDMKLIETSQMEKAGVKFKKQPIIQADSLMEIFNLEALLQLQDETVIPKEEQPYELSEVHSQVLDYPDFSEAEAEENSGEKQKRPRRKSDENISAIASDSSFEKELRPKELVDDSEPDDKSAEINTSLTQVQKVKRKLIKRIKSHENNSTTKLNQTNGSTQFNDGKTNNSGAQEISEVLTEKTSKKKSKKKKGKKAKAAASKTTENPNDKMNLFLKYMRDNDRIFLEEQKEKDPYLYINKKTHKIELYPRVPYMSTSMNEVFEIRNQIQNARDLEEENRFIKAKMPDFVIEPEKEILDLLNQYSKSQFDAYQQKTVYKIIEEEEVSFDEDDDDALILALQPFDTITSVGYGHLLTHKPVKFAARRSDIIVSSTLSITLTPADSEYRVLDKALLTPEQCSIWCHNRHLYQGITTKHHNLDFDEFENFSQYDIKDSVQRSDKLKKGISLNPEDVKAMSELSRPKLIPPTLLTKPLAPEKLNQLTDEERRLYNIQKGKYETNIRVVTKKIAQGENPVDKKFNLAEADLLMTGKHHEEEEPEEDEAVGPDSAMSYLGRQGSFQAQSIDKFEQEARELLHKSHVKQSRGSHSYIPDNIRQELDLPGILGENQINFNEVIKQDLSRKRKTPQWSGQDVLQIGLNNELSKLVTEKINAVRVWPKGTIGKVKKARVALKMMVKHSLFDNAMTFCVALNTVVMGMEQYNMPKEEVYYTELASTIFTYIFIGEMTAKLLAIGPAKYLAVKMNWLDGGVVTLSLVEILMNLIGGGGGNLSAFRTVRVLRTFRVLRIARLLRALQSMKVIIAVIARSISSFIYITILMFVFIFIFTLLGMSLFGGNFPVNDNYRGYFDSFIIAFLTSFQIVTTENWNTLLFSCMTSQSVGKFIPTIYYISWIFIGNYILLNLFLAILLDGFLSEDDEEIGDVEEMMRLALIERRRKQEKEKERRLKKLGSTLDSQSSLVRQWREQQASDKKQTTDEIDDLDDMDEKVLREIFMDEGLIKKKDKQREARLMFLGVECEKSLYFFTKQNKIRYYAYKLYKKKIFDNTIMVLILLASIKLALDTYLTKLPDDNINVVISADFDQFLFVGFLFECITKIISLGFIMDDGSYLQDSWNKMDFFIVCTSVLDQCLVNVDLPVIKILRLLRTLRPLRVISQNKEMRLMVGALFESLGAIANVCVVVVAVWLMYAIFAINIFAGKFFHCDIGQYVYHTKFECNKNGGSWVRYLQNFDNIFLAMQSLFDVAVIEGWPDVMNAAIDAVDVDKGPQMLYSKVNGFFFVGFIFIGSFFLMNFFTGVMFLKYNQVEAREKVGYTPENITWVAIQKMIIDQRCEHAIMNKPNHHIHPRRFKAWKIVTSTPFEVFILGIILLNVIQMGIMFENAPVYYAWLLDQSNYFFTAIFVIEMLLKMQAYSWRYFEPAWHKFDFFIVSASILDIILSFATTSNSGAMSMVPQISRIMRVLRVTRIIKLAGKNEGLQALMSTITLSIGALANVCILLMLTLFIFSILGVFMFQEVTEGDNFIGPYRNFVNFWNAFQNLYILTTGENWNYCMFDLMNTPPNCKPGVTCGTSLAPIYFISFVMFVQNVMLNLFVLVIISQFETYYMAEDNPISKFKKNLDIFMVTWIQFTVAKHRCIKIREKQLSNFFRTLPMPFGLPPETTDGQMKKIMLQMGIRCDDGYVYFNELLYRCMRRKYGFFKLNRRMQIIELKTQYKIYQITLNQQNMNNLDLTTKKPEVYDQFFSKMIGAGKSSNPFLLQMYYNISFNTWLNYSKKVSKRERFYLKQEKVRAKCIRDGNKFEPVEYVEEVEPLIQVTIEVSEVIFYSSDEEMQQEQLEPEENAFKKQSDGFSRSQKKQSRIKNRSPGVKQIGFSSLTSAKKSAKDMRLFALQINKDRQSVSPGLINSSLSPVRAVSELRVEPNDFTVSASNLNQDMN